MTTFDTALMAYQQLPLQVKSLMLSTMNPDGTPHASFAPFVMDKQHQIYLYTSALATHTQNLLSGDRASALIIADEAISPQIFARQRITYDCQVNPLTRDDPQWPLTVDRFEQRFGNIIQILRQLPDFQVFQLVPRQGRFVMGFGAAYDIDPTNLNQLIPKPVAS